MTCGFILFLQTYLSIKKGFFWFWFCFGFVLVEGFIQCSCMGIVRVLLGGMRGS
jgi:hypothetical protein